MSSSDKMQTVVGKTVTVHGEIVGNESLTVEGRVEGKVILENSIYIREGGIVNADITSHSITVAGSVTGNIVASDKVEILRGGTMVGDIKSPRVVINDGANLRGNVEMDVSSEKVAARQKAAVEASATGETFRPTTSSRVEVSSAAAPTVSTVASEVSSLESHSEEGKKRSFSGLLARR